MDASLAVELPPKPAFPMPGAVAISLGLHGLLVFALLGSALFAPPRLEEPATIHVKLARLGTPRDQKLLPRKTEPPAAAPAPPVEVAKAVAVQTKTEPPKPTAPKPPKQDHLKNTLAKLQQQVDQTGQADGFEHGTDDQTEGELYWARVKDRILRFYVVPNTIPESERRRLIASLEIHIGSDGTIVDSRTEQSSGNLTFDRALESAIKRVRAFPPPPPHLLKQAREGVTLEFHAAEM